MEPDVSAIIVSHNTVDLTIAAISHLVASAKRSDLAVETILVDNASTDGTPVAIHNRFPDVHLIALGENLGFAGANNLAIKQASAPYLLFLNPDSLLLGDALGRLHQFLQSHPRAGLVGSSLVYSDGEHQDAAFLFPTVAMTLIDLLPVPNRMRDSRLNGRCLIEEDPIQVDHPLGACMFARRTTVEEIGGFDQDYYMYSEELDLCRRMKRAGWEVWSLPHARVVHYGGASTSQVADRMYAELFKSRRRFASRHYARRTYRAIDAAIRLGMCWKIAAATLSLMRGKQNAREASQSISTYLRIALSSNL